MVHHLQPPTGAPAPSDVWRCAALVLTLSAVLSASSTFAAEPTKNVSRDDFLREQNIQPTPPPADPSLFRSDDPQSPPVPQEIPLPPDRPRPRDWERTSPRLAPPRKPAGRHAHEEELSEPELIQRRLTVRYGNPAVVQLLKSLSAEQGLQLYAEVSILIDTRHLKPSTYEARVKQAAKSLLSALENRAFLRANGLEGDPSRSATFRSDVEQLVNNSRPISGRDEAYQALRWTIRAAEQHAGLRPSAVVLEFVYGSTDSLDKYSGFVPNLDRASPSAELEDHIVGVGVEIKPDEQGLIVVNALSGGPAAEAGLRKGDLIESVNGKPVAGETLEAAVNLITGPPGSRVTLGVRREERVADVPLVRRRVEVHSVSEAKMLDQNVGYIKLDKFAQNSSEEFDRALWGLYREGMKSLVIDVRGNPGGLLTTAIQMCNKFVPSGTLVSTRGRDVADNSIEQADRKHAWKVPMAVLVDENSASASEIFAAAIQENGRGLIVGERTYGKGTVQTHFPLQTVSANLRLTTAQFFSPSGRTMAGAGVEPDIHAESDRIGRHAHHQGEGHRQHEGEFGHDDWRGPDERQHHEAAYRHGADFRGENSTGQDAALAAAIEAALSQRASELAQSAGNSQHGRVPDRPNGY
jgi:carboxyl-terminal processing protease